MTNNDPYTYIRQCQQERTLPGKMNDAALIGVLRHVLPSGDQCYSAVFSIDQIMAYVLFAEQDGTFAQAPAEKI